MLFLSSWLNLQRKHNWLACHHRLRTCRHVWIYIELTGCSLNCCWQKEKEYATYEKNNLKNKHTHEGLDHNTRALVYLSLDQSSCTMTLCFKCKYSKGTLNQISGATSSQSTLCTHTFSDWLIRYSTEKPLRIVAVYFPRHTVTFRRATSIDRSIDRC